MTKRDPQLAKRFPVSTDRPASMLALPKATTTRVTVGRLLVARTARAVGDEHSIRRIEGLRESVTRFR